MTINYPERFAQAKPAGFDGVFEWDFLSGCFPRSITPMDFDAVVEIGNHFLVFETKQPGKTIEIGQKRTFESLMTIPAFTVFMLWGKTPETITRLIVCHGNERRDINPATVDDVRREAKSWAERADKSPRLPLSIDERRMIFENLSGAKKSIDALVSLYTNDDFITDYNRVDGLPTSGGRKPDSA